MSGMDTMISKDRELFEKIFLLTKEGLENYHPSFPNPVTLLDGYNFIRMNSISAFWEESIEGTSISYETGMEDLLLGFYSQQYPVAFLISSDENQISIFLGIRHQDGKILPHALLTSFPGAISTDLQPDKRDKLLQSLQIFPLAVQILGTPTNKQTSKEGIAQMQIEGLIRGLTGEKWSYLVIAHPVPASKIISNFNEIAQEIREIHVHFILKGTVEEENRLAKYYTELLEAKIQKFQIARTKGAWIVDSYLFTPDLSLLQRASSILVSTFNGDQSLPDKIRTCSCGKGVPLSQNIENLLNTAELAVLTQVSREEFPGFGITKYSKFGVHLSDSLKLNPVYVGEIIDRGILTGNSFSIPLSALSKHGLIVGVTGSGKTNTCFYLLSQVWGTYKIPFMVIESAKSEYRDLLQRTEFKDCSIFTLGDDTIAPFRLNPFEVPDGILVQSHIDFLKSLFQASFVLYAPMPYVLEESIHEIYTQKGWDLAQNINHRGGGSRSFPTLTDLYYKIEEVVDRLGYDERITMDVKAGLKARINNLRIGGKGLMLDTRRSLSDHILFEQPLILELKQFVNDEEKAFIIGLLLIRLYEYYESQYRRGTNLFSGGLHHITLIEEAHRLLKNVSTESHGEESSNPKGKAVETFTNILSEIRAYGEGVLIAEQIPVKLTPDAIKNTNLKIVQRMVAADDRDVMGETITLNDQQKKFITTLQSGEALVYAEGLQKSFLIKIPKYKDGVNSHRMNNQSLASHMRQFYDGHAFLLRRFDHCQSCKGKTTHCEKIFTQSENITSKKEFQKVFQKLFHALLYNEQSILPACQETVAFIRQHSQVYSEEEEKNLVYCCVGQYGERSLEARGNFYHWNYPDVEKSLEIFNQILNVLVTDNAEEWDNMVLASSPLLVTFRNTYRQLCHREIRPFASCILCSAPCQYQFETVSLLRNYPFFGSQFDDAFFKKALEDVKHVCIRTGQMEVWPGDIDTIRSIALCFLNHKAAEIGLSSSNQEKLSRDVQGLIEKDGFQVGFTQQ